MNIAIIEDQELFAKGLRAILSNLKTVKNIVCFYNGKNALDNICAFKPDVIFLDLNLPDCTGIDVLKELRSRNSTAVISILSMYKDNTVIAHTKRLGANAYLSKDAEIEELKHVINNLKHNNSDFYIGKHLLLKANNLDSELSKRINITDREREILKFLVDGFNTSEISEKLIISEHTVNSHRKNLRKKFNVSSTTELISFILKNKIII